MAGGTASLQQELAGAAREVLPQGESVLRWVVHSSNNRDTVSFVVYVVTGGIFEI